MFGQQRRKNCRSGILASASLAITVRASGSTSRGRKPWLGSPARSAPAYPTARMTRADDVATTAPIWGKINTYTFLKIKEGRKWGEEPQTRGR